MGSCSSSLILLQKETADNLTSSPIGKGTQLQIKMSNIESIEESPEEKMFCFEQSEETTMTIQAPERMHNFPTLLNNP